ncbi:PKD domain-containing protein [Sediminibacterium sp.]|uniref:PKD domain-containing protein n=1 Tax=Sediminibacterium sp. TaxID=1917865 RepID=UPI0025D19458|nr:PKD domain-containing protein [Sediminibacterium sp.]
MRKPPELMKKCSLLLLLFFVPISLLIAQDFSNRGKDFWLAYPAHIDGTNSRMALYISATENTTGQIELDGKTIPFTVTANQATTIQIPPTFYLVYNAQADGINAAKGIHITSLKPIVVYSHILNAARSGSTLVFPTNVLGKEYISLNFSQYLNPPNPPGRSQITVVATEDNTTVELNLKANSSGAPVRSAGQAYNISLNKGDVYQVQSLSDLTGSTIRSISTTGSTCKPIAVFTGSTWTGFCSPTVTSGSGADNLFQQVFPSNAWGRNYITAPFARKQGDIYRIIVKDPTTVVNLNGSIINPSTLKQNSHYDFSGNLPNIITADKPILVLQIMTSQVCDASNIGDPEIITINPLEQTINNVTVVSARRDLTPPSTNITVHYLNVLMKTANTGSLKIDGAAPVSQWVPIPNSDYSYIREDVTVSTQTNPSHNIQADSGFIAIAYGLGNFESYGYNAGTNIVDLNPPVTIQNPFPNLATVNYSATCVNSSFNLKLALSYQPTKIVLDFLGASNLTGPPVSTFNPTNFDSTYNSNGKTFYVYKIPQTYTFGAAGTYPIKFTTTSVLPQSDGCSNTNEQEITDNIIVNDAPIADFSISSIDTGCVIAPTQFTDLSTGSGRAIVAWNWEFGDGAVSTTQSPVKTYATAGDYNAKLTAITDFGCVASKTVPIKLSNKPVAAFAIPAITCVNSAISFTDASTIVPGTANNSITQWKWNLDNGAGVVTQTAGVSQTHTYTTWGNKDVYLNVVSNTGCISDTFRIAGGFKANPLPVVGFILPEVCLNDATATFTDTSSIADGTEAGFSYLWKFDDGVSTVDPTKRPVPLTATTNSKSIPTSYKTFGNYTVSLQVTSSNGCIASDNKSFTVNGSTPIPQFEVANLLNGIPLCTNDSIKIINQSTVDFGDVTKLMVIWDSIGAPNNIVTDQIPAVNKQYSIRYGIPTTALTPGTKNYSITLRAFSGQAESCSKSITKIVTVTYAPAVSFTDIRDICYDATPRLITQGTFISALPATPVYSGKGISAAGLLNPITTGVGNDTLKYFVQNSAGCKDSAFQPITVWPSPVAKWGIADPACEKNNILFTDSSVANFSNIAQWNWNFGDGKTESRTNATAFTHVFDTAQTYTTALQVVTDSGCVSTSNQQIIRINHLPKPAFSLPEICLPDGRGTFINQSSIADGSEALFSYVWNFGDPNDPSSSTLKQPTHKYTAVGPNNVQLKITTKDGCVDSLTQSLNTIYPWPRAAFSATPTEVCQGDPIQFTDLGNGITSAPVRWEWNLGGGNTSTLQNPSKVFTDSGSYTISYYFYNSQGCVSDTVSQTVVVHPYPVLELGPNIVVLEGGTKALKPQFVYGTNLNYQWTPPLYLNSDIDSIPKTTPLGDITYRLNLTGIGGCMVTDTIFVKLLLAPIIPNAFSPNGDGINDRWRIQYLESYPGATVDVYDRYGMLVFSSIEYAVDWDGTRNGKSLPIGTYYYIVNPKNGRKIITGSVTIIK